MSSSSHDNAVAPESLFASLPHSVVLEYLPLRSVLSCRESCVALAEAADGLSPRACASMLLGALGGDNVRLIGSWGPDGVVGDVDGAADALSGGGGERRGVRSAPGAERRGDDDDDDDASAAAAGGGGAPRAPPPPAPPSSSAFDAAMRCLRVAKHLPREAVVAFGGRYGRHCLPISEVTRRAFAYPPCRRGGGCSTCRFRVPPASAAGRSEDGGDGGGGGGDGGGGDGGGEDEGRHVDEFVQIRGRDGFIDLTRFYRTCAPNLPPDLVCPLCRSADRTLVLGQVSYLTSGGGGFGSDRDHLLTYTPEDLTGGGDGDGLVSPPLHSDDSMPIGFQRYANRPDAKYALSIHCAGCERFGVLSPAGRCMSVPTSRRAAGEGECANIVPGGMTDVVLGATFVRTRCRSPGCLHPVPCSRCSEYDRRMLCRSCSARCCRSCHVERLDGRGPSRRDGKVAKDCSYCSGGGKKRGRSDDVGHDGERMRRLTDTEAGRERGRAVDNLARESDEDSSDQGSISEHGGDYSEQENDDCYDEEEEYEQGDYYD